MNRLDAFRGCVEALRPFAADGAKLRHVEADPDVGAEEFWMCGGCGTSYGKPGVCDVEDCMWANAARAIAALDAAGPLHEDNDSIEEMTNVAWELAPDVQYGVHWQTIAAALRWLDDRLAGGK